MQFIRSSAALCVAMAAFTSVARSENWPGWRGPRGDGTSAEKNVPVKWSGTENVLWKTPLATGHASPILWGNRLFTVEAVADTEGRDLLCLDKNSGNILWQQTVVKSPLEKKHRENSHASSTPATDGKLIYVAFLDVQDMVVAAYDFDGKQKWLARPGVFKSVHGFCTSPILHNDKVIVNGDHDGESYLAALDKATGKTLWKVPRANHTRSYCAPIIRQLSGRTQMVLAGDFSVASYDPDTGKLHWYLKGPTEQYVASLVYNERADLLFLTAGFPQHHLLGLRHNGSGDLGDIYHQAEISHPQVAWHHTKASMVSYVPSPISAGDYFLVVGDTGMANCLEAKTGEPLWSEKIGRSHASLVSANGLVYFLNDDGVAYVVKPGKTFELIAKNELGEPTYASPAISDGKLYLRGGSHLFCIGAPKTATR
ncbi:MAG: PQQ-binding-like beta-propeller repeat protein [Verrucomicrobia bacterium]|nr:PQQ-binding-like beta-propeller repeat protein [Verrucomicrobiota bacterium]